MTTETETTNENTTDDTTTDVVDSVNEATTNEDTSQETSTDDASHKLLGSEDPNLILADKFKDPDGNPLVESMTKTLNHQEKMISKRVEELKQDPSFVSMLTGAPEDIGGYEIPEDLMNNEYVDYSDDSMTEMRTEALKLGINNDQMNFFLKQHSETMAQFVPTSDALEAELKESWGEENFTSNINAASDVLDTLGADISPDEIIGNLPLIKLAALVSKEMGQDSPDIKPSLEGNGTEEELNELMASPDYWVKDSETRIRADKILNSLYA